MGDLEGLLVYTERVGQKAAESVARKVLREIRMILRPGYGYRTGKLRLGYKAIATPAGGAIVQTNSERLQPPIWKFVEFGTRRMAARPHIRPALEIVKARMARRSR